MADALEITVFPAFVEGFFSPASDVILDAARIPSLSAILRLARYSTRIVKASFGISAAYNLVGLGIAATGFLSPVICALLMPVSSVSVVLFACGATTWAVRRAGLLTAEGFPSLNRERETARNQD